MAESSSSGIGLSGGVFLVFLFLKLFGKIAWSWWWVTAPLWGPLVAGITILAAFFGIVFMSGLIVGAVKK